MRGGLRLGAFVCPVSDMGRAVEFYSNVLGLMLHLKFEDLGLSVMNASSGQIWLFDYGGRLDPGDRPTQVVLLVDEGVDDWPAKVTAAGSKITQEIHDDPLGRIFIFEDSEGNQVEIRQPSASLGT